MQCALAYPRKQNSQMYIYAESRRMTLIAGEESSDAA